MRHRDAHKVTSNSSQRSQRSGRRAHAPNPRLRQPGSPPSCPSQGPSSKSRHVHQAGGRAPPLTLRTSPPHPSPVGSPSGGGPRQMQLPKPPGRSDAAVQSRQPTSAWNVLTEQFQCLPPTLPKPLHQYWEKISLKASLRAT